MLAGPHRRRAARSLALALCSLLAPACASLSDDIYLGPLVSHVSAAGGRDDLEFLGGAVRILRPGPGQPVNEWELHPLVCHDELAGGDSLTRYLVPLGQHKVEGEIHTTKLLPLYRVQTEPDAEGGRSWYWISLPGIIWKDDSSDRVVHGVFPFGGVLEQFGTYDRITFALFPLFMRTEREGGTYYHFLWPLFSWGHNGHGELDFHLWPFFGIARPGESESGFALWPFILWSHQRLSLPEDKQPRSWMVWPLLGHDRVGTYSAWSTLWPFFGYAHDPSSGYWSWDGPWPLVRIARPGTSKQAYRTRFWPLYSYFEGDGLKSRWILWPLFNQRDETYHDAHRIGESFFPFWQEYEQRDLAGQRNGAWSQFWPLYQYFEEGPRSRLGFPTLLPLWHLPDFTEHYAWIWELYTREADGPVRHERSWLGVWRRETDASEQREYLTGLWSRRKYRDGGKTVRETSLLFGLLRWRSSEAEGLELLRPAFPGPGWPARATP